MIKCELLCNVNKSSLSMSSIFNKLNLSRRNSDTSRTISLENIDNWTQAPSLLPITYYYQTILNGSFMS